MRFALFLLVIGLPTFAQADEVDDARRVLASYETIRAALAADNGRGVAAQARRIAQIGASSQNAHLRRAARAGETLATVSASDLPALRRAFGELSRPLVVLLSATPALTGYHLFECPMADGYKRWIQRTEQIENPYMGSRMLTCGAPVG